MWEDMGISCGNIIWQCHLGISFGNVISEYHLGISFGATAYYLDIVTLSQR
jgi:hypothetical protein